MKKYKYLILTIILVLAATIMTGCGADNNNIENGEVTTSTDTNSGTATDVSNQAGTFIADGANDADADIPEGYFTRVGNEKITVAIPITWKDKYYAVIDEDTVMLYQKQAIHKGVGRLCRFEIFTDDSYKEIPWGYDIVTQEGEKTLIVQYPSDVQSDIEDEMSMKEYNEMYKMLSKVVTTAKMKD